jgi:hypothetical protein
LSGYAEWPKVADAVIEASDFLTPDFRIWPQKGKFATEPSSVPS